MTIFLRTENSPEIEIIKPSINDKALAVCKALGEPDSIIEIYLSKTRKNNFTQSMNLIFKNFLQMFGIEAGEPEDLYLLSRSVGATCANWSTGNIHYGGPLKAGYLEWNEN